MAAHVIFRLAALIVLATVPLLSNATQSQRLATGCLQALEAANSSQGSSQQGGTPPRDVPLALVVDAFESEYLSEEQKVVHIESILALKSDETARQAEAIDFLLGSHVISARTKAAMISRVESAARQVSFESELYAARSLIRYFRSLGCSRCVQDVVARLEQSSEGMPVPPGAIAVLYRLDVVTWSTEVENALMQGCASAEPDALDAVAVGSWDPTRQRHKQDVSVQALVRAAAVRAAPDAAYLAYLLRNHERGDSKAASAELSVVPWQLRAAATGGSVKGRTALARILLRTPGADQKTLLVGRFLAASAADGSDARARLYLLNADSTHPENLKHWSAQIDEIAFAYLTGNDTVQELVRRLLAKQL